MLCLETLLIKFALDNLDIFLDILFVGLGLWPLIYEFMIEAGFFLILFVYGIW